MEQREPSTVIITNATNPNNDKDFAENKTIAIILSNGVLELEEKVKSMMEKGENSVEC